MLKGFKIICLECGKEAILIQKECSIKSNNQEVYIIADYGGVSGLKCDCGNEIVE